LSWQANYGKNKPKLHNFNSVQEIEKFFACIVGFTGLMNSNMLPEFSRELMELLLWQPNYDKSKPKLHKFQFCAKIEEFFACAVRYTGLINSNMLPEFSREPRELPWQPELGKNKPKWHRFQFCTRYGDNVCVYKYGFRGRRIQIC